MFSDILAYSIRFCYNFNKTIVKRYSFWYNIYKHGHYYQKKIRKKKRLHWNKRVESQPMY